MLEMHTMLKPGKSRVTPSARSEKRERACAEAKIDTELVRRFVGGDESAFVDIIARYRPTIFNTALRLLHNRSDAEEVTQDTFLRAYRGLAKFRGDSSLATWLYRIATNLAHNRYWYLFRRRRHDTLSLDHGLSDDQSFTLADKLVGDTADPAQESTRSEFSALVKECMDLLAPPHREILALCNGQGLAYFEIAEILGIHLGTVKSRVARARKHLRAFINSRCPTLAEARSPSDYFLRSTSVSSMHMAA